MAQVKISDLTSAASVADGDEFELETGGAAKKATAALIAKSARVRDKMDATTAPGATDDSAAGYAVGSKWVDTVADKAYICVDATASAAVWKEISVAAGSGEANTASNLGAGVGVFETKVGVDLGFRSIVGAAGIDVTEDVPNEEIDVALSDNGTTNAKLADMAANTVKVRNAGTSGDPSDVAAAGLTEEPTPAAGDFLFGWESGGALRKFDVGDLPSGGDTHPVDDTTSLVRDPVDNTKQARLDVGAVAAATTRVVTVPNQDVDLTPNTGTFPAAAHAARHTDGSDDIQDATASQKGLATAVQITKLDGIESGATADQTNAEIKTAYEANANTNEFSDAEQTKLAGIATGATKSTGKHTIPVPASAIFPATTNGCAALAQIETTTNKVNSKHLAFDSAAQEYAHFEFPAPKSSDESGTFTITLKWSHPTTSVNFGVVWELEMLARSNDDALDAAWGTPVTVTDTGGTTDDLYASPVSAAITPGGTWAEGDTILLRIGRKVADAGDTMAVDARLHGIELNITTNAATDD